MQRSRLKLKLSEDEDYGTEESAYYDGATGEITAESDWTPVGEKIRIQIK